MKRFVVLMLAAVMAIAYGIPSGLAAESANDPKTLQQLQDEVFAYTEEALSSEDYVVENVQAVYFSKEYMEELAFNSRKNVFFGYTLDEINAMYEGKRVVFTLGEDHKTIVKPFETYDVSMDCVGILKNVAVGAGVILLCVTVTALTGGTGTPKTVQILYAVASSAVKGAESGAAIGSVMGGVSSGIAKWSVNGDLNEAVRAAAEGAGEGIKWGAVAGAISGGIRGGIAYKAVNPSWKQSEQYVLEKYGHGNAAEQIAYLNGQEVSVFQEGSTRPDVVVNLGDHLEAIEVKNYNLEQNASQLCHVIKREVTDRVAHLPEGSTQRIVLDVRGRGYTQSFTEKISYQIQSYCADIYADLPVDVIF